MRLQSALVAAFAFSTAGAQAAAPASLPAPVLSTYSGAKIVSQADAGNPLVGLQLFVRAGLDRQTSAQNGLAALTAESLLHAPAGTPALPLRDAIAARGGMVNYTVDGGTVRFYLEGVREQFASALLPLFAEALAHPDFSAESVAAARSQINRKIVEDEKIPLTVGMRMLNTAFYTDSNAGMPQYGLPATLAGFSAGDVRAFFQTYYRRGGAVISADGGLDAVPAAALTKVLDALPMGTTSAAPVRMSHLNGTQRRLVTHRDIAVPWLVAQFRAPSIDSPDFGAMLVLTSFMERTAAEVAENPTITTRPFSERAVGTVYNFDERPANVILYINGGFGDPSRPFNTALSVIQIFAHSKLSGDLDSMKRIAEGTFLDSAASLEDRAWLAAVFASQNAPPDYIGRSLAAIAATKPADLQRVARKYLDNPNVAIVLPRDLQSP